LNQGRFRPKKRFGQNFLHDRGTAVKIVDAAGVVPGELVVELGPGHGVLTKHLVSSGAHIVALELDRTLVAELDAEFDLKLGAGSEARRRIEIVSADFTSVKLADVIAQRGYERCVLIGNIPYHITRHVLFDFLVEEYERVSRAVIMMQREVGDRIASAPGSRVYGITSVVLQSLYEIEVVTKVAAGSFFPRPKVASIVLSFKPLAHPLVPSDQRPVFLRAAGRRAGEDRRRHGHRPQVETRGALEGGVSLTGPRRLGGGRVAAHACPDAATTLAPRAVAAGRGGAGARADGGGFVVDHSGFAEGLPGVAAIHEQDRRERLQRGHVERIPGRAVNAVGIELQRHAFGRRKELPAAEPA
jgi:16S rRNA (adenine1518-N6/adenine1519-N6)-dimethyltransferase